MVLKFSLTVLSYCWFMYSSKYLNIQMLELLLKTNDLEPMYC